MKKVYWEGERRLIFSLGHMSYRAEGPDLRKIHLRILVPPADSIQPEKVTMIKEVMQRLYGNPLYECDYTMTWRWIEDEFYIHIIFDFDEDIWDPEAFAFSQLGLIRWEWGLARVKAYLKFYMVYICGYTPKLADEKIEDLLNAELVKEMRKFDWIEILPDAANAGRHYDMRITASSYSNDEMGINFPESKKIFTISFWDPKIMS